VLESPAGLVHPYYPDLRVLENRPQRQGVTTAVLRLAETESYIVEAEREPRTEGYIEIINAGSGNRVVTIIEVLSPSNKTPGDGMEEYLQKQREITQSPTNLVEIDLLRIGRHVVAVPLDNLLPELCTPYLVCVRRAALPSKAEVYPIPLSKKLPVVKIPLRQGDADVPLDLQALIEQCYRKGRYEKDLNYGFDPHPPLTGPDAKWAAELLRGKGFRPPEPPKRKRPRKPSRSDGE